MFSNVTGTLSSPGSSFCASAISCCSSASPEAFLPRCSPRSSKASVQQGCWPSCAGSATSAAQAPPRPAGGSVGATTRSSARARWAGNSSPAFFRGGAASSICTRWEEANSTVCSSEAPAARLRTSTAVSSACFRTFGRVSIRKVKTGFKTLRFGREPASKAMSAATDRQERAWRTRPSSVGVRNAEASAAARSLKRECTAADGAAGKALRSTSSSAEVVSASSGPPFRSTCFCSVVTVAAK
mmetsp:Transcript_48862/g.156251  ORF Transcript_48862/g.156251 Transcript_48862/m.156251 type:complete len:242 (+) Transcript_48862:18-743(+)